MNLIVTLVFMVTAWVGVWAAYDRSMAQEKFILLGVGLVVAHGIDWLGRQMGASVLGITGIVCAGLAAILGTLLLISGGNYGGIIASGLVILIPLGINGAVWLWHRENWLAVGLVGIVLSWVLLIFLLTGERTAWLALTVGVLIGVVVWSFHNTPGGRNVLGLVSLLTTIALIACVGLYALFLLEPTTNAFHSIRSRTELWQDALVLIQDYFFTGSGLAVTSMVYSSYVYLLHVPYQPHVHNFYLQLAVEQGIPGLLTFIAIAAGVIWARYKPWHQSESRHQQLWIVSIAALAAMLFHGLLDAELYASQLVMLTFLPFGFVAAAGRLNAGSTSGLFRRKKTNHARQVVHATTGFTLLLIVFTPLVLPKVQAVWQANLGTVAQTQAELSLYSWPTWPIQDETRRAAVAALTSATDHYRAALALDPANATAHRRLGQIALSLGDYVAAQQHLEMAYAATPNQRVTRQLLGEAYAVSGYVNEAVSVWQTISLTSTQIKLRRYWYKRVGTASEQAHFDEAVKRIVAWK